MPSDRASLGEGYAAARVELEYRAVHDGRPSPGHEWAPTWLLEDLAETIEEFVEASRPFLEEYRELEDDREMEGRQDA